jgi:hypothetical protein
MALLAPEDSTVGATRVCRGLATRGRRAARAAPFSLAASTVTHQATVTPPNTVRPALATFFLSPDGSFATLSGEAGGTTDPAAGLAVLAPVARRLPHGI